jgi:hypothetical protein
VTTLVDLSSLVLTVHFSDGSTVVEPGSYFSLALDGQSFNGTPIGIGGTNPQPVSATLTGTLSPTTITLFDSSTDTISDSFTATVLPSSPPDLADGDLAIIYASTGGTSPVPEPGTMIPMALGIGLGMLRNKRLIFGGFGK